MNHYAASGLTRTGKTRRPAPTEVPHPTGEDPEFVRYLYLAYAIVYHGEETRGQRPRYFDGMQRTQAHRPRRGHRKEAAP